MRAPLPTGPFLYHFILRVPALGEQAIHFLDWPVKIRFNVLPQPVRVAQ
jgi:hypothetical protein